MSADSSSLLRKRIVEAIRQSGMPFWLTFNEGTFGIAGFIDFQTDKAYMEVLFFAKAHPKHPFAVSIASKVLPVKEIIADIKQNSRLDERGEYADPATILDRVDRFRLAYIDAAKDLLNKEKGMIEAAYEVADSPGAFIQDVLLHVQDGTHRVSIDYGRYPVAPRVEMPASVAERAGLQAASELSTLRTWEPTGKNHVVDVLDELCTRIWKSDGKLARDYQVLEVSNIQIPGMTRCLDFRLPRGRVAGLVVEGASASDLVAELAKRAGNPGVNAMQGTMSLFGAPILEGDACVVTAQSSQEEAGMKVGRLLLGLAATRGPGGRRKSRWIQALLEATGLGLATKERVGTLTRMDVVKLNIARNVILGRKVFFIDFNATGITRLEHIPYIKTLRAVARGFHVIFIMAGPGALISMADQIITITPDRDTTTASLEAYQAQVSGDVITIQAIGTAEGFLDKLKEACKSPVIEEIRSERYKIFSMGDARALMVRIYSKLGASIYKISVSPPSLDDFLQFTQLER